MIVVFKETCVPKTPLHAAFPMYLEGIAYEADRTISRADADKYVADGRAVVVGEAAPLPVQEVAEDVQIEDSGASGGVAPESVLLVGEKPAETVVTGKKKGDK